MTTNLVRALQSLRPREVFSGLALIAIAVIVASCNGDATGPGAVEPPTLLPKEILSTLLCKATPSTQTLSCSETPDALGNILPSYMLGVGTDGIEVQKIIIGGQNTNVKLTSSNVVNNTTTHDFSFDVNVKNLRPQAIGTVNGTTTDSSLSVFFYSGPTTTGGTGSTTVSNPTGIMAFTGPNQPYFRYEEMVAQNATSSNKNWILHYDPTVTTFSFLLLVSANVKYPEGYIDVAPNPGGVSVGATLQMTDSVRDALGYARADQSETWSLSDSTRASIDSNGLLTGIANGSVVVTATQGVAFGSSTVTVSGGITPTAVVDSSAANSAPGVAYHVALNTQYVLAAPGILSNDTPGNPAGTVSTFGADSLGGVVTDHAAGSTVSPLPGHADGSLTVASNGAVTFTPSTDFTGYYAFHYRNTNSNGSTSALVRIAVGVRPLAGNSTYSPGLLGNVKINTSTSTNTKVNAAGDKITYHFVSNTWGTGNVHADGTYDFNPAVGYTGSAIANLVYNVSNGFGTSTNGTVSFNVTSRIWFVADSASGTGDGRYGSPLKCLVGPTNCLSGVTLAANDIVHIAPATYANTAAFTLTNGMKIIGQGASGVFADATNANVTWPADAGAQPGTAGARPVLNSSGTAVFIGGGANLIRGVLMGTASQASLSGSSVGGMTVGSAAIVNPSGGGVLLTSSTGSVAISLDSVVATGGTNGISMHKQAGNFSSGITKINNPSGTAITVDSSGASLFGLTVVRKTTTSGVGVSLLQNTSTSFAGLVDSTSAGPTLLVTNGGTVAIGGGNLNAIGGIGIDATNTAFSGAGFGQVNVSGTGGSGINLNAATGTLAMGSGSITGGSGSAINVTSGSSLTLTYSGSVTAGTGGRPVRIDNGGSAAACPTATLSGNITSTQNGIFVNNCNSGTILFSGASKLLKTAASKGVELTSNTGATINFTNGGLVDSTTTGNAFEVTGGGTVSVAGSGNILRSLGGTPLTVTNTTIGAGGLNFVSIAATGGTNGIVLNTTGATAGLTVTGTGTTTGSGGTLQLTTGDLISLASTKAISLANMNLTDAGNNVNTNDNSNWIDATTVNGLTLTNIHATGSVGHGVKGDGVTNLIVSGSVFNGGGLDNDQANFHGFDIHNLLGTSSVTGTTFSHSNTIQFHVNNDAATAFGGTPDQLTVSGTTWNLHTDAFAGDHLSVNSDTGGNFKLIVNNASGQNTFVTGGTAVQATAGGTTGKMAADISGVTSGGTLGSGNNNTAMAVIGETGGGSITYDVHNNTSLGTGSVAVKVTHASASGTSTGKIDSNTITHVAGPGTDAIAIDVQGVGATGGTGTLSIFSNSITGNYQRGIVVQSGTHGVINATIHDNSLFGTDLTGAGLQHLAVFAGISGGVAATTRLNMFNNIVDQSASATYTADYRLNNMVNSTFQLQDFAGSGSSVTDIQNWVVTTKSNQPNGTGTVTVNMGSAYSASAGAIPTPP